MAFAEDLKAWYEAGDREAGGRLVEVLSSGVALPSSFVTILGEAEAEEIQQEALIKLLDCQRRLLSGVNNPRAFAATVARNLARDALRRHRRRGDERRDRKTIEDLPLQAKETADATANLDADRALGLLHELSEDSRLAVLLVHAPNRLSGDDWELIRRRHPPGGDLKRPTMPLDRDDASTLLWPSPAPEPRPARMRRLDRIRKVLRRAYDHLAKRLAEP